MKYTARAIALSLLFTVGTLIQPTRTIGEVSTHHVSVANPMSFATGPTPFCDPNDPDCVPFN